MFPSADLAVARWCWEIRFLHFNPCTISLFYCTIWQPCRGSVKTWKWSGRHWNEGHCLNPRRQWNGSLKMTKKFTLHATYALSGCPGCICKNYRHFILAAKRLGRLSTTAPSGNYSCSMDGRVTYAKKWRRSGFLRYNWTRGGGELKTIRYVWLLNFTQNTLNIVSTSKIKI